MSTATKTPAKTSKARPTVESLVNKLTKLGLQEIELPANATKQSRSFFDPKANISYITFTTGHVARTVAGPNGKRVSLNPTENKERKLFKTEVARLNRIVEYIESNN